MTCKGVIQNTFVMCGEGGNYCSDECMVRENDMHWYKTIAFIVCLFVAGMLVGTFCGCGAMNGDQVERAGIVGAYNLKLQRCIAIGKAAGSYAAYEECARTVDAEMCRDHAVACNKTDAGAGDGG